MKYKIVEIYDDDYGCEGVPEDQDPMCILKVKDEEGNIKWIRLSSVYIDDNRIKEGDVIEYDS